ncbi:putative transcription factor interactor and regulator CCHC(Zn) family [Helianthus annuus]|nr:putative transcription factor interactor and regulator CCHC(Zn) family [Helianthus annuus]
MDFNPKHDPVHVPPDPPPDLGLGSFLNVTGGSESIGDSDFWFGGAKDLKPASLVKMKGAAMGSNAGSKVLEVPVVAESDTVGKPETVMTEKVGFYPPKVLDNGELVAVIKPEKIAEAKKVYSSYLYGYFVGKDLPLGMVRYHLYKMWKKFGILDISANNNGIFFFKFRNEVGMFNAIDKGPWLVNDIPLCLKKWEAGICIEKTEPSSIPMWVTIPNLPLELWNSESICSMLSCIGEPILFDKVTLERCKMKEGPPGFARVLVEIKADTILPDFVKAFYPEEEGKAAFIKEIKVGYQVKIKKCSACKVFGHDFENCSKRVLSEDEFSAKAQKLINDIKKVDKKDGPVSGVSGNEFQTVGRNNKVVKGVDSRQGNVMGRGNFAKNFGGGNKMNVGGGAVKDNNRGASTSGTKNSNGEIMDQSPAEQNKAGVGLKKGTGKRCF